MNNINLSNLAYDYVNDIPWDNNPAFAFSGDTDEYLKAFKNIISELPGTDSKILFQDDVWDFSSFVVSAAKKDVKFNFAGLPDTEKEYCKFFVLFGIMNKRKVSTINIRYSGFKSVFLGVQENTIHKDLSLMTTDDIISVIESRDNGPSTKHNLYQSVFQVCDFIIKNYKLDLHIDVDILSSNSIKYKTKAKNKTQETKVPNIPEKYFTLIINKCLEVMKNEQAEIDNRIIAASIVLLSQTGLRPGDLLQLKIDCMHETTLPHSGLKTAYIHYTALKPSKAHAPLLEFNIFCNKIAREAVEFILKLRNQIAADETSDSLFLFQSASSADHSIGRDLYYGRYNRFLAQNLIPYCFQEWEGIEPISVGKFIPQKQLETLPKTIYIPEPRQFRVHMATSLYEKGVPLTYIQKYMSHLSEYMMGYYVRPKDTYQENIKYSEKVIREIVEDDVTPLGGSMLGEDIKANIQKFVTENKLNVHDDIESVVKALGDRVIIRGKSGGVCIKTSLMPCSKDARTNEMMCAYNLCPNLFHFYYMIDITLTDYETLKQTYQAAKDKGQLKAAQKELSKVKSLLRRKLIPEMDELEKELNKNGFDEIVSRYPTLMPVIENLDEIRKDTESWMIKS